MEKSWKMKVPGLWQPCFCLHDTALPPGLVKINVQNWLMVMENHDFSQGKSGKMRVPGLCQPCVIILKVC